MGSVFMKLQLLDTSYENQQIIFFSQTVVLCIVELSGHEQISGGSIFGFSCDGVGV